ncbi:MAG: replicative DNA helicase [Caldisericia bacterium]|nr:replicative DNA helicase [Caldisericia bacterium]MDD4614094.1 replicative DNA helicase [Caldisericia bacterium]
MPSGTPPHSSDAEQAVLGSILKDREAFLKIQGMLQPDDFYDPAHSIIFKCTLSLFSRNSPIDIVTLPEELRALNLLEKVGGTEYILFLSESTTATVNIVYYSEIILDRSLQRKIIKVGNEILGLDFNSQLPADELMDQAEALVMGISEGIKPLNFVPIREVVSEVFTKIEKSQSLETIETGVMTNYRDLDEITNGFQKSDLIILAARPSIGKTSLAMNFAVNIALKDIPVALFSLEMSKIQIVERVLASHTEINLQKFRNPKLLNDSDQERIVNSVNVLYETPIFIDDSPDVSVLDVRSKARRLQAEHKDFIIIIDYLQLMHSQERVENRVQEISKITRQMKNLARELRIPILLLSQLSRDIERRQDKKPILSDLRESGSIEQDADLVMFLHRNTNPNQEDDTNEMPEVKLIVAKHRNGPTGTVNLLFDKRYTKFRSFAKNY